MSNIDVVIMPTYGCEYQVRTITIPSNGTNSERYQSLKNHITNIVLQIRGNQFSTEWKFAHLFLGAIAVDVNTMSDIGDGTRLYLRWGEQYIANVF